MKGPFACLVRSSAIIIMSSFFLLFLFSYANAGEVNAADVDEYEVLERGSTEIKIDADFGEWRLAENVLVMGKIHGKLWVAPGMMTKTSPLNCGSSMTQIIFILRFL